MEAMKLHLCDKKSNRKNVILNIKLTVKA